MYDLTWWGSVLCTAPLLMALCCFWPIWLTTLRHFQWESYIRYFTLNTPTLSLPFFFFTCSYSHLVCYSVANERAHIGWHTIENKLFISLLKAWIISKKKSKYKCESASKKNKMANRTFQVQHKLAALPLFFFGRDQGWPGFAQVPSVPLALKRGEAGTLWAWLRPLLPQRLALSPFFPLTVPAAP